MVQKFNEPILVKELQDENGNIIDLPAVATATADIVTAQAAIGTLETQVATLQAEVAALELPPDFPILGSSAESVPTFEQQKVQKVTMTLTALVMNVTEALDYGGVAFADLGDINMMIVGCEASIVVTKGNQSTGLEATVDLDMAIGTVAATNVVLAGNMENVLDKLDIDADSLTPDFNGHSSANTSMPMLVQDGPANKLYINCGLPVGISVDDTLTMTGSVTLYYIDLGNVTS